MSDDSSSRDRLLRQKNEFIDNFFRKGAEFTRELLDENDSLRRRIVELQELRAGDGAGASESTLRELIDRIHALEKEREAMLERLTRVDDLEVRLSERFEEIERENHDLAALYVAQGQLHSALDVPELVNICIEILLNFVGAAKFCVLLSDGQGELHVLAGHGMSAGDRVRTDGVVAKVFGDAELYVAGADVDVGAPRHPAADEPYVCLPVTERARTIGVIPVWGFLSQKQRLQAVDYQLFDMLMTSVGIAMEAAYLATRVGASDRPPPYEQYSALM